MLKKYRAYDKLKSSAMKSKISCIAIKKGKKREGMRSISSANDYYKAKDYYIEPCAKCGYTKPNNDKFYPAIFKHSTGYREELREPGIYGGGCGSGCGTPCGAICPGDQSFQGVLCNLLGDCIQVNTEDGRVIVGRLVDIGCGFITVAAGSCLAYIRLEDVTAIIPVS